MGARVSHVQGDQKTSHFDQRKISVKHAEQQGWDIVGSFEDLDVSAIKTSPWERPDLKPWLTDQAYDWDALIFTKTDRVFRSARDAVDLASWCERNKRILVLVEDGITLDYYHPDQEKDSFSKMLAEIFLLMAAMFAQIEGRRYVQRAQGRVRFLRTTDRWGHGLAPYTHMIVKHPTGAGKALDLAPENQTVLHDVIVPKLLEKPQGWSLTGIVNYLNDNGYPSPRESVRIRNGVTDKKKGKGWTVSNLKNILTSPSTQGIKVSKGKPVLDSEGKSIRVGPPSFDDDTWAEIQIEMAQRAQKPRERRHGSNPILGIGKCGSCRTNLRQETKTAPSGTKYRYYRCGNSLKPCAGVTFVADQADSIVADEFLEKCGDLYVRERLFEPGEDHSYELSEVMATIESLREDRALGLFSSPEDERTYRDQMKSLISRRDELQAKPVKHAGWVMRATEKTYNEAWPSATPEEKREMLLAAGVELTVNNADSFSVYVDREKLEKNYDVGPLQELVSSIEE